MRCRYTRGSPRGGTGKGGGDTGPWSLGARGGGGGGSSLQGAGGHGSGGVVVGNEVVYEQEGSVSSARSVTGLSTGYE